jgi:hypothetical protein
MPDTESAPESPSDDEPQGREAPPSSDAREEYEYLPPEPWYYGFLEKYTLTMMWVGIVLCTLPYVGFLIFLAMGLFAATAAGAAADARKPTGALPAAFALDACSAFFLLLPATLVYGLTVLGIVFGAALILLSVDAARHLRKIHHRLESGR